MITGRREAAMRSRTMPAIFRQLAAEDTLVPPNLSTTQGWVFSCTGSPMDFELVFFENVAQLFF